MEAAAAAKTKEAMYLRCLGKVDEAIAAAGQAVAMNPNDSMSQAVMGDLYSSKGKWKECIGYYKKALELKPDWPEVRTTMSTVYKSWEKYEDALELARESVALQPDSGRALETLTQVQFFMCDWTDYDELLQRLAAAVDREIAQGKLPTLTPWHVSTYPLEADFVLRLTQAHAKAISAQAEKLNCPPLRHPPRAPLRPGERLRVAYVSSEFNDHPVSHLMDTVFESHDRSMFEVFCFSLRPSDGSAWRKRVEQTVEHFIEVGHLDTVALAQRISEAGIHVAVNLNGFTKSDRNQAFALRFAPLQIQFLGFPGAMCASWIDYSVCDEVVCPPEVHKFYTEALAKLPHSMIPTGHKRAHKDLLSTPLPSRDELGLPEDAVVYACSNQLFKITPDLWDVWCRILQRVPNSVLWLQRSPKAAESRLRSEWEQHGMDPARLIFTDRCAKTEYMRRQGVADVFLDTPIYNAYTTGADNLWSGCPMVTMPLERMASRSAASLCYALGEPEMVVSSYEEYEELAVELGLDEEKRLDLRRRIEEKRLTCPLYDTLLWTQEFEQMLMHMWNHHAAGKSPMTFCVRNTPPLPRSMPSRAQPPRASPVALNTAPMVPHAPQPLSGQALPRPAGIPTFKASTLPVAKIPGFCQPQLAAPAIQAPPIYAQPYLQGGYRAPLPIQPPQLGLRPTLPMQPSQVAPAGFLV